jgi:hypothetical protein
LIGPLRLRGELRVFHVMDKVLPSVADPGLRQRAEQLILQRAIDHEVATRVQWHLPSDAPPH